MGSGKEKDSNFRPSIIRGKSDAELTGVLGRTERIRPHRGINNSAKSRLKTRALINFRFSQDVKEVMR